MKDEIVIKNNSCAIFSPDEIKVVVEAADKYIAARNVFAKVVSTFGGAIESGFKKLPDDWQGQIVEKVRVVLEEAQKLATAGMDNEPGRESSDGMYKALVMMSGAGGGAAGLPGLLVELPTTTMLFFRSIADIARAMGHDLTDPRIQAVCFEAFAYGGPLDEDDDADVTFFTAKLGTGQLAEVIARVALRYAINLSPKIAAQAVPLVGGALGAGINYGFLSFYQDMARVLFTLVPLEFKHDPEMVRSCFASVVKERVAIKHSRRG